MYYNDYDTEPIGGGNPYYCCSSCKRAVPEINGRLEGHSEYCTYRQKIEQQKEIDWLKFLIKNVVDSLPHQKDWLDPAVEKAMKEICKV